MQKHFLQRNDIDCNSYLQNKILTIIGQEYFPRNIFNLSCFLTYNTKLNDVCLTSNLVQFSFKVEANERRHIYNYNKHELESVW